MNLNVSQAELEAFLQAPRHAILGTNTIDGPPHLSPVWYLYENGRFYISIASTTVKHKNLRRDPQIALCIDGGRSDTRTVMATGLAELVAAGEPQQLEMRRRIIRHYHTNQEEGEQYIKRLENKSSELIIFAPQKILTQNFK